MATTLIDDGLAVPERPEKATRASARQTGMYRAVWRWHFYAGLFTIPIIVMLCLSGIVWLFRPQINRALYGNLITVAVAADQTATASYADQLKAVQGAHPDASISAVEPPAKADRSTKFDLTTTDGKTLSVFVNPYTGSVIGQRDNGKDPTNIALKLHGSLMTASWLGSEKWGDRLIEIVASWSILLVTTGVYLWWPRGKRLTLKGVLKPRFDEVGRRTFWRDVHAITGILFSFVTLFFLVTGLFWTGWWGTKIDVVADRFGAGKPAGVRNGISSTTLEEIVASGKPAWSRSKVPVPLSGVAAGGGGHAGHGGATGLEWDPTKGAPLDAVVAQAQNLGFPPGFAIYMPADATGSYAIANWPDIEGNPNQRASASQDAYIDQYTGEVLGNYKETQYGAFAKLSDLGISLHEGRQFGAWNQLGTLVATLAILLSSATSIVMWRKRRPVGLGAPPKVENHRATWTVGAFAGVLGIIFPPLGLTLVAVLLLDLLVVNKVPALARAFGTAASVRKPAAAGPGGPPAAADAAAPLEVPTISPEDPAAQANGERADPASSNGEGMDGPSTWAAEDTGDRPVFPL